MTLCTLVTLQQEPWGQALSLQQLQGYLPTSLPQPEGPQVNVTTVTPSPNANLVAGTHIPYLGPLTGYISWPLGGIFLALGDQGTYIGRDCGL